jgi:arginine decarboxylase
MSRRSERRHTSESRSRDAQKSVVAGLIFAGVKPQSIKPRYDADLHLVHLPSPKDLDAAWSEHPNAAQH